MESGIWESGGRGVLNGGFFFFFTPSSFSFSVCYREWKYEIDLKRPFCYLVLDPTNIFHVVEVGERRIKIFFLFQHKNLTLLNKGNRKKKDFFWKWGEEGRL